MHEQYDVATTQSEVPVVRKKKSNALGIALALILAVGSFFSGIQVDNLISREEQSANLFTSFFGLTPALSNTSEVDLSQFWEVWKLLDEKFIAASSTDTVTSEEKMNGAIRGLVATYDDPYTVFLPPVESAAFAEDISGNFSGIGMEVGIRDNVVTVIAPLPETPAERAGLVAGDLILKIDGESTEGMQIDEAVSMIRGEKGTSVVLSVYREGDLEIKEITVIRDTISVPTVVTEIVDGV